MSLTITHCPCTLQPGFNTYSPPGQKDLFGSRAKKVSAVLPFPSPGKDQKQTRLYNENRKGLSISGYQEKYSLALQKNDLSLVNKDGHYILKPVPAERLMLVTDMPANEHLTMQIANQLFGITTASCGMIFFNDDAPAYLTKRFDYKPDGSKYQVEDFATLMERSPATDSEQYKIRGSYADIAYTIDRYVPAAIVEKVRFFKLVVFNYLFCNGDAHLKNFSLMESKDGDYILSPAYDLMCTALHIDDGNLALQEGLYDNDYRSEAFMRHGVYTYADFILFAEIIQIPVAQAQKIMQLFSKKDREVKEMIQRSFLTASAKRSYFNLFKERRRRLEIR